LQSPQQHHSLIGGTMREAHNQNPRWRARRWVALLLAALPLALAGCDPLGGTPTVTPLSGGMSTVTPLGGTPRATLPSDLALLPVPTQSTSFTPTTCNIQVAADPIQYRSVAARAWASEQVVLGTVTAQEARWNPRSDGDAIATYSVLRVEARARGLPFDPLFLVTSGGTIGGCTTSVSNLPRIPAGARVLLFLTSSDRRAPLTANTIFAPLGDAASVVVVGADGDATQLLAEVRAGLRRPPPPDLDAGLVVPLDRAPIVDP